MCASRESASPSSWRTRSRVTPSSLPIASSDAARPRSRSAARPHGAAARSASRAHWRTAIALARSSPAASAGSISDWSANRSPNSESPSAELLVERDRRVDRVEGLLDVLAACSPRQLGELLAGRRRGRASSWKPRRARGPASAAARATCTGMRIVFDWFATARWHRLADPPGRVGRELVPAPPVELLDRAVQADDPLLDQVASGSPCPWYRRAIETTRRRFELIIRSFAALSPRSTRFVELDLLRRVQQRVAADLVHEHRQRVGRRRRGPRRDRVRLGAGSAAAAGATTSTSRVSSSWRIDATASSSRSCSTASASSATSSTRPCSSACSRNSRTAGSTIIVVSSFSSFSFVGTCGALAEPQAKAGTRRAPVTTTLPGFGFPNQPQPSRSLRTLRIWT